ncbi:malate dehydrogenase [Longilinea arvoryzae]|uniref:Malate dehydrogenase n=1 Tax=Longilinea arvoryzae TaxID=360412 RepID=A0A0S7B9D6_9CHLR|nr:Ldh family oxidoreductase [Longilinea arvoryzae]GAP14092.1 malate dehydrogenase [Longilinea arvoryzae]
MARSLLFRTEDLSEYIVQFFVRHDITPKDAKIAADILLTADLRGVDSHGIIRLDTYYGTRLRKGLIDPHAPLSVVRETGTTLALDGGHGLGQIVGYTAMSRCIEKARQSGLAMTTVRNSNHYGIAGYYAMMALAQDMIGISFTNSQPLVAPTYGCKAMLGTNPIAVAVPSGKERPYVLDMATSIVPIGRITVYDKAGKPIPEGWGIDHEGKVTTNPKEVLDGGALMPLGGIDLMRGYKGYGLAMLVDIFSGVLAGSAFGDEVAQPSNNKPARVGHFFAAIRIDAFRPVEEFKQDMDHLIQMMKESPKAVGQERIYIHGEKEFEMAERRRSEGIPLLETVVDSLKASGQTVGLPFDLEVLGVIE